MAEDMPADEFIELPEISEEDSNKLTAQLAEADAIMAELRLMLEKHREDRAAAMAADPSTREEGRWASHTMPDGINEPRVRSRSRTCQELGEQARRAMIDRYRQHMASVVVQSLLQRQEEEELQLLSAYEAAANLVHPQESDGDAQVSTGHTTEKEDKHALGASPKHREHSDA